MRWMSWTTPSALFFVAIVGAILGMLVWELVSPTRERRGLLPMPTTRGDRFFIGLLASAFVHIAWLALTTITPWFALALSAALMAAIGRWG
jgi:predicted small integral membrane protein